MLEDVILNRLNDEEDEVIGVPVQQFAYRKGHSPVNAVDLLGAEIEEGNRKGFKTVVLALDIKKAFDSVWKKGLIYKLYYLPIEMSIKTLIADFMNNRVARVIVGEEESIEFAIERGPVLYCIYTGDIKIENTDKQGLINFADDSLIWAREKNVTAIRKVEKNFNELTGQMEEWGIEVNQKKTKSVIIRVEKKRYVKKKIKLQMGNIKTEIESEKSLKYLGQVINTIGNCSDSIDNAL